MKVRKTKIKGQATSMAFLTASLMERRRERKVQTDRHAEEEGKSLNSFLLMLEIKFLTLVL